MCNDAHHMAFGRISDFKFDNNTLTLDWLMFWVWQKSKSQRIKALVVLSAYIDSICDLKPRTDLDSSSPLWAELISDLRPLLWSET